MMVKGSRGQLMSVSSKSDISDVLEFDAHSTTRASVPSSVPGGPEPLPSSPLAARKRTWMVPTSDVSDLDRFDFLATKEELYVHLTVLYHIWCTKLPNATPTTVLQNGKTMGDLKDDMGEAKGAFLMEYNALKDTLAYDHHRLTALEITEMSFKYKAPEVMKRESTQLEFCCNACALEDCKIRLGRPGLDGVDWMSGIVANWMPRKSLMGRPGLDKSVGYDSCGTHDGISDASQHDTSDPRHYLDGELNFIETMLEKQSNAPIEEYFKSSEPEAEMEAPPPQPTAKKQCLAL